jgi:hypothetical protein
MLPVSIALFALALSAGEAAVGTFGFVAAYELVGARDPVRRRVLALAPVAMVFVLWALVHRALGYGAHGSGLYIDPTGEPLRYLFALGQRIPTLIGAQLGGMPADLWLFTPHLRAVQFTYGAAVTIGFALLLRFVLRRLTPEERRALAWVGLGSVFALFPVAATFPLDRLLLLPSLGGAALVGAVITELVRWAPTAAPRGRVAIRALVVVLIAIHGVLPIPTWYAVAGTFVSILDRHAEVVNDLFGSADSGQQPVVILVASDPAVFPYAFMRAEWQGRVRRSGLMLASMAPHDHRLTRIDPRTLELAVTDGGSMIASGFEHLYTSLDPPFRVGDRIATRIAEVEIRAVRDDHPTAIALRFASEAALLHHAFVAWGEGGLEPVTPPPVGTTVELPWSPGLLGL